MRGREAAGQQQPVALAQRYVELAGQPLDHVGGGAGAAGLDEAQVPGRDLRLQRQLELAESSTLAPLAEQRADLGLARGARGASCVGADVRHHAARQRDPQVGRHRVVAGVHPRASRATPVTAPARRQEDRGDQGADADPPGARCAAGRAAPTAREPPIAMRVAAADQKASSHITTRSVPSYLVLFSSMTQRVVSRR